MAVAEQIAEEGILFSPKQAQAFERRFWAADSLYVPDGESYWYRASEISFQVVWDAIGSRLPKEYQTAATKLMGRFRVSPDCPAGRLGITLKADKRHNSYSTDNPIQVVAIENILDEVLQIEPKVLRERDELLEHVRLFGDFALVCTDEIQKTYDPDGDDRQAIHLSLGRSKVYTPKGGVVASQLALGRAVSWGESHFNYWQTLHSSQQNPSRMLPQTACFRYANSLSAPSLGRNCLGMMYQFGGLPLPESIDDSLHSIAQYPRDLRTFEGRLREANSLMVGPLSTGDAVRLVSQPIGEDLRLSLA
jgi:hypothetical protein